jgi:hypothetical protein
MVCEYRQIWYPWTDLAAILLRHHTHGLRNVTEIMDDPGREQLSQCHGTERRMFAWQIQLARRELPRSHQREIVSALPGKLVEQRRKRPIDIARPVPKSVVWLESRVLTARKDDERTGNPISLLAVDQMSDDIERAERVRPFRAARP